MTEIHGVDLYYKFAKNSNPIKEIARAVEVVWPDMIAEAVDLSATAFYKDRDALKHDDDDNDKIVMTWKKIGNIIDVAVTVGDLPNQETRDILSLIEQSDKLLDNL